MRHRKLETNIRIYDSADELSEADQTLLRAASQAMDLAYAPYSNFKVGAAVRLTNGTIVQGANQENAAYPMCLCAERVALGNASLNHPNEKLKTLAIRVRNEKKAIPEPAAPCGSCRQAISEMEDRQQQPIRILMQGDDAMVYEVESGQALLPLGFNRHFL
ncbi:cytidine deaminase [Phaeodactylibacter sp.]|jgi:cytidine deaminase|uniref:cytidine deaminase n=1 Tax=Phaeodactylibacter sp. TaxID=1940289 RepID=UPI002601311F|nr:cytidine deaminase [Phaeodactylibacter sp.]MCI4651223.1 cytidine deaminase [Phaeodactylibacter sp.]MCI5093319.1 cytidine deaminase [Phaeodactylibacter sp.]